MYKFVPSRSSVLTGASSSSPTFIRGSIMVRNLEIFRAFLAVILFPKFHPTNFMFDCRGTSWLKYSLTRAQNYIQSFLNTTRGYRRLSFAALAGRLADKRVRILTLLPNTHSVISVQFLSPISSKVSSVRTWCRRLSFLFFTEPVSLNLLACLLIVLGLGTGPPGNFTRNLRRVSEQVFLLFIYVLWIYTRSHNENSCLDISQIAIIAITTLTALTCNKNRIK